MESIGPHLIELKVHGLTDMDHGRVPARLFAAKLTQLVAALEAADTLVNGTTTQDYILANMHMSEPTALLKEVPKDSRVRTQSAIPVFNDAVDGIKVQDSRTARLATIVSKISRLTGGAKKRFGFAEITSENNVVRIDDFLQSRVATVRKSIRGNWYSGAAIGSFDGVLDYVDLRGSLPQIKLTLSAGGKEIDCVCSREDIESLGDALHNRVRVYGRAIYSSESPLPLRVEVSSIQAIKKDGDLSRWQGAFHPFTIESWDADA
ncbi:MAG: hypothetical protein KGQ26_01865 [Rhodospirillales bacterium]|nr:hypothetical protein [Rhodospirillales bacterium]